MLSIFLRAGKHMPKTPAPLPSVDTDDDLQPDTAPESVQLETAPKAAFNDRAEDLSGLLSVITANAEFLEVVYGENRNLKNILIAVDEAKQQIEKTETIAKS